MVRNNEVTPEIKIPIGILLVNARLNIADKDKFVKKYYKPDLDIYSLDELVKKGRAGKDVLETKKKKTELDVFLQIDLYRISKIKKVSKDMPKAYLVK